MFRVEELLKEAKELQDETSEPDEAKKRGEKIIGMVPEELRPIFRLMIAKAGEDDRTCDQVHELKIPDGDSDIPEAANPAVVAHVAAKGDHETLADIFWNELRKAYPAQTYGRDFGVRTGWEIVTMSERETGGCCGRCR